MKRCFEAAPFMLKAGSSLRAGAERMKPRNERPTMRFLQIVIAANTSGPRDPEHLSKIRKSVGEAIENGTLLATGALAQRATSAARVIRKEGKLSVEDPPSGDGRNATL